jgi:hypothetical protein
MSAILLEKNGRMSSTKRTKHINIRYFFVKDRVESREIRIEHCPTDQMLADFFTKPLQGNLFRQMRDKIMNIDPSSKYHSDHRSVLRYDDETATVQPSRVTSVTEHDAAVLNSDDEATWTVVRKRNGPKKKVSFLKA